MRSLLSILLIGGPVTLMLSLVGLTHGMSEDSQKRQRGVGAEIIVLPSTVNVGISFSGAAVPQSLVPVIEKQPHVAMAMGVINQNIELPLVLSGIDLDKFNRMSGGFTYIEGHTLQSDDDILLDKYVAEQKKAHVGGTVKVLNRDWHVAGIVDTGKMTRMAVKLDVLQELVAVHNKVTQIYVRVDNPANIPVVMKELEDLLPNNTMKTMADFMAAFDVNRVPGVSTFTNVIVVLGVMFGLIVVCLSMYMAVLQRTREIGMLKALGAGKPFILGIILAEALVMGLGGTIAGIVMSFGAYALIRALVPALAIIIVPLWWPITGLISLLAAALGSLYPGWNAASHDAIEALSYE